MSTFSVAPGEEWLPGCPLWLYRRIVFATNINYPDFYAQLIADNDDGTGTIYKCNDLTIDMANEYLMKGSLNYGLVQGPFVGQLSTSGYSWTPAGWPQGTVPVTTSDWDNYGLAAAWALIVAQGYSAMLLQQVVRAFEFGHYGRTKGDSKQRRKTTNG